MQRDQNEKVEATISFKRSKSLGFTMQELAP